jgi:hypothetical protein
MTRSNEIESVATLVSPSHQFLLSSSSPSISDNGTIPSQGGRCRHRFHIDCTVKSVVLFSPKNLSIYRTVVTPFDVVKTRLQTQPPSTQGVPHISAHSSVCCQPTSVPCVRGLPPSSYARSMSTFAHTIPQELVCIFDRGVLRTERVNGFYDAVRHVWRFEGLRGLWKGVGTTL